MNEKTYLKHVVGIVLQGAGASAAFLVSLVLASMISPRATSAATAMHRMVEQ